MANLGQHILKIRPKNAGPFWLAIDIFCFNRENFGYIQKKVPTAKIANLFKFDDAKIKRFDISELNVVKFSLPRPHRQCTVNDRDMHGSSHASIIKEMEVS